MKKLTAIFVSGAFLCVAASALAADAGESADFATGNMADAVKAIDANGDGMVSKDEFMAYQGARYDEKAAQFATGNMTDAVKASNASKKEIFMKSQEARFAKMTKNADGMVMAKDMHGYLKGPASK